ncbi:MAG: thioredoxin [Pseudomonadota bacterium]|nr:thioredoxin [Pseudomonadota bacterium]
MEQIINPSAADAQPTSNLIKDTTTATFMQDVIEASKEVPIIVDFWAPWCGPCKQLGPILEKVVKAAQGSVKLVKVDIDQNQEIAQQLRIQSIPAVFAFYQGKPVDGFQGAVPESQIQEFVNKLTQTAGTEKKSPIDEAMELAQTMIDTKDFDQATSLYTQVLEHEPTNLDAKAGLAQCFIAANNYPEAQELVNSLSEDERKNSAFSSVISTLELAEKGTQVGDLQQLQQAVANNPKDKQARFDLALALYTAGEHEAAVNALLEIISQDIKWKEEAARFELLKLFDAMGSTNPVTISGRRKLASILFA